MKRQFIKLIGKFFGEMSNYFLYFLYSWKAQNVLHVVIKCLLYMHLELNKTQF